MKLAVVRQKYTPFGGAERFVERALNALREEGTEVTLLCRSWEGAEAASFPVEVCDPPWPRWMGRLARDRSFAEGIGAIIASGRFDLVQSHERIPGCHVFRAGDGVHASWLEIRDRARGLLSSLSSRISPWHRWTVEAEAAMFRHPNLRAVICNSDVVRQDIARRFGVPPEKLRLVRNGVDLERFHPRLRVEHRARVLAELGIPAGTTVVLYVGSGFERKGVPFLLRALAAMEDRRPSLLVVGKDRWQQAMGKLAAKLGVASRVRFLGGLKDVAPLYGAADLFCLPTLYDPFPNAAMEALAAGLPVVTTGNSGAAELIQPGRNGLVCEAADAAGLAAALDELAAPGRAAAMSPAARASALPWPVADTARRLIALYRDLGA